MQFEYTVTKNFFICLLLSKMTELEQEDYVEENREEITQEELNALRADAKRLEKAEKTIVELKRATKNAPDIDIDSIVDKRLAERQREQELNGFLTQNKDLEEYKDKFVDYTNKGLSLNEAKYLVTQDESYQNRLKTNSINLTDGTDGTQKTTFTTAELERMSQSDYCRAMDRIESGKAKRI